MYKCSCGLDINPDIFPNHKTSKRHKHFKRKKLKHFPFKITISNDTNEITEQII